MMFILAIAINIVLLRGLDFRMDELKVLRIVGGKPAHIENHPYQLCIILKKQQDVTPTEFRGGAVIVSNYWAVTAAHCVEFISSILFSAGLVYVRGNTSFWQSRKHSNDHEIIFTHVHPRYNEHTNDYDLALMKVKTPFLGRNEKPIQVASNRYQLSENAKVTVSGWGLRKDEGEDPVPRLRAVDVKVIDYKKCKSIYAYAAEAKLTERMICAWDSNKDACIYDFGGPMVHDNVLTGVVSWGMKCASVIYPGVYSKMSAFYVWIRGYEKINNIALHISFTDGKIRRKQRPDIRQPHRTI